MWPLVAAMAASAAGNYFGAKSAAKSQAEAQAATDANNYRMFQESRGSAGSAVLPEYLKAYEAPLATDAATMAKAVMEWGGGAKGRLSAAERALSRYTPAMDAGDGLVIDLATGKVAQDRKSSLAPVLSARTALAKTQASGITQGLDETLAKLRAFKTNSGFRGLSTFDINRSQAATIGARTAAAQALQQAQLDNAMATQGLDESNLQMRIGALELPYQLGQQRVNFLNLPASSLAQFYQSAMSPLSFFRLPTANAPYQTANPVPSTGEIAGSAVGALGQQLGQYFAQQQLMQQLQRMYQPASTYIGNGTWVGAGGDPGPATLTSGLPGFGP